jgi:putative glycosyltransferase
MYRSEAYLREFHARVRAAARQVTEDYEIVLVNDGSPDGSLAAALGLQAEDARVKVVDLSRNFGHHQAMWAGLEHARGDWVFLIDCDLEESPEWLALFAREQETSGSDVVYGVQEARGDRWSQRWGAWLFYKLFNALCDDPLPQHLMTVRLMSRRYVDALLMHEERSFVIAGLWARTGFQQQPVRVAKAGKKATTYSLFRRAKLFVEAITSFSSKPLIFIFYLGVVLFTVSALIGAGLVTGQLLGKGMMAGWPSLMVSIWLLGGLIIFCQGIQGIYLAKVYLETKRRPVTLVRQVYERPGGAARHERLRLVD